MQQPFSIPEALRVGWHKTRAHSGLVFGVVLTLLAVQVAQSIVQRVLEGTPIGLLAQVVLVVASVVLGIGATRICLRLTQSHVAHYREIIPPMQLLWPYVAATVLAALAVVGGLILLIIPGIFVALRLSMVRFEIIDGAGIKASLHKSWALTKGHALNLLGFFLVLGALNILGAALLMVGLLVTIPVSMFAYAHVYLKLKGHTH